MMEQTELIARQALRIDALEKELAKYKESAARIRLHLVCVGGPLNDNKLRFSSAQRALLWKILQEVEL